MRKTNYRIFITAGLVLAAAIIFSGCTSSQPQDESSHSFDQTLSLPEQHFRPDGSCYYTSQVDVRNMGTGSAENVMIRCHLKDPDTNGIIDTESRFFEVIDENDHKVFTVNLDGECNKNYGIGIDISEDYKQ